ncbi:hypothetical protein WUBG_12301, partial [Wuchereria bancrofti]
EVDTSQKKFVERLREAFAIPSISGQPQRRADVIHGPVDEDGTTIILSAIFRSKLGANVELCDIGKQTLSDGSIINLPLVLFGTLDNNKAKKTLLIYDHLDDGKLYGRGSTDDKGPVIAWTNALETLRKCEIPIPYTTLEHVLPSKKQY